MTDIGYVNGLMEQIENCRTEETIMPMRGKCILEKEKQRHRMANKETIEILMAMKKCNENQLNHTCSGFCEECAICDRYGNMSEVTEALTIAIEALKKQNQQITQEDIETWLNKWEGCIDKDIIACICDLFKIAKKRAQAEEVDE